MDGSFPGMLTSWLITKQVGPKEKEVMKPGFLWVCVLVGFQ